METEVVKYKDRSYPARRINMQDGLDHWLVSVTMLRDALFNEDDEYKDDEAGYIDDKIFFYLEPKDFTKSEAEIREIINKEIQ